MSDRIGVLAVMNRDLDFLLSIRGDREANQESTTALVVVAELIAENERLNAIINTPHTDDFIQAVSIEAEHQRQRWGSDHDAGKTAEDWFWLVGYLAGKALHSTKYGMDDKALHHVITTASVLLNWWRAMRGETNMRPGIDGKAALVDGSRVCCQDDGKAALVRVQGGA